MKLERNQDVTTTTSVSGIALNDLNEIVLVREYEEFWSIPKGRQEANESLVDTAMREVIEETGLSQLEFIAYLGNYQRFAYITYNKINKTEYKNIEVMLFKTKQMNLASSDPAINEVRWVELSRVSDYLSIEIDKQNFKKYLSAISKYIRDE